jgi:uncharacterized membrane protein
METLRLLLACFWIGAGIPHLIKPNLYITIMPRYFSYPGLLVIISGILEIIAGMLVAYKPTAPLGGLLIIWLLTLFMLVHVDMLQHAHDRYKKIPLWILWLRIPLQFVLGYWAWITTQQ